MRIAIAPAYLADVGLREEIERGLTLPAEWYVDESVFEDEKKRIFEAAWQYAGATERLAEPGDFLTCRAGDVPLVVVRDAERLRALVNVCRHRGSEVVRERHGRRKTLQCGYHAWTYELDGRLRAAPRSEEEPDFDVRHFSLLPARVETWGPLVFANASEEAEPLAQTLGELPEIVADAGLDVDALRLSERVEYEIAANWKVVVDNYLECYHCPVAHPSFTDLIDLDQYHLTEYETFSIQRGPAKERGEHPYRVRKGVADGLYAFVWPNFALNVYPGPGNVSVNAFVPLAADRTLAVAEFFFSESVGDEEVREFIDFVSQVNREDVALCESVQRGLRSGRVRQGRLLLSRERGLQHFQGMVYRALRGDTG
jgi:choline monooxygenase